MHFIGHIRMSDFVRHQCLYEQLQHILTLSRTTDSHKLFRKLSHMRENIGLLPRHKPMLTVLVIIKLTKIAVVLRLRCGSCKLIFWTLFHHFALNLRTLYIVWSLVRCRVTRRLTRLQTMCNVL